MSAPRFGNQPFTSLLDPLAFPPFNSCPQEHKFSFMHYPLGLHTLEPSSSLFKNWCFLGEIERISGIGRLCLDVKDREGTAVRIYFYLDRMSAGLIEFVDNPFEITYPQHVNVPQQLVKEGNTIAVLYAKQHRWLEGSTGIRIEDGDMVKIFPCGLNRLLSRSDQIIQCVTRTNTSESRACDWCGEKPVVMRCSGCYLAWYCNKECQMADWSAGEAGHKTDCKLTKEVKLMMKQEWNRSDSELNFTFPFSG